MPLTLYVLEVMSFEFYRRTIRALLSASAAAAALTFAPELTAQSAPEAEIYTAAGLRPGDVVRLQIYREPDLSGDFAVDEAGVVVFPKLGPLSVIRESPESLKARLVHEYEAYLTHSSISVTLLRRVQILGAVRNPGLYPVDATMTVADALALAGGATPQGNPKQLELIREGRKLQVRLDPGVSIARSPIRSGDQLYLPERSWLSRNAGVAAAGITGGVSLLIALLRR